jgi:hypothetical protein
MLYEIGNLVACNQITDFFCTYATKLPIFGTKLPDGFNIYPTPLHHQL